MVVERGAHLLFVLNPDRPPSQRGAVGERVDERRKGSVVGCLRDDAVEGQVGIHDHLVVGDRAGEDDGAHAVEGCTGRREVVVADAQCGPSRRLRLENPAHRVHVVPVFRPLEVDHERHRGEQQGGVERGDVGAVTLSGFEHSHDAESTHALA